MVNDSVTVSPKHNFVILVTGDGFIVIGEFVSNDIGNRTTGKTLRPIRNETVTKFTKPFTEIVTGNQLAKM